MESVLGVRVILCQFHNNQSIERWISSYIKDQGGRMPRFKSDVQRIQQAFKEVCRSKTQIDQDAWMARFWETLADVGRKNPSLPTLGADLATYFEENWFCDRWRPSVMDYPSPSSFVDRFEVHTNNYEECGLSAVLRCLTREIS